MLSGMADRSELVVKKLSQVDPDFVRLCEVLYGNVDADQVWSDVFAKMDPDPSALNAGGDRRKRAARGVLVRVGKLDDTSQRKLTAGLSATGAVAGGYGMAYAGHDIHRARQAARAAGTKFRTPRKTKALLGLEAAGLGGEVMATRILHNDTKRQAVVKAVPMKKLVKGHLVQMRRMSRAGASPTSAPTPASGTTSSPSPGLAGGQAAAGASGGGMGGGVGKNLDVTWSGSFSKFDDDKRLAFGWANVSKLNGQPVVDRQGDYIDINDMEDAAYTYVMKSRIGGDMHRRGLDPSVPHHAADLVESFVITDEKVEKMGLPPDTPRGWWVGFKVHDDDTWGEVRKGGRTGFSIHGKGLRKDMNYDELMAG